MSEHNTGACSMQFSSMFGYLRSVESDDAVVHHRFHLHGFGPKDDHSEVVRCFLQGCCDPDAAPPHSASLSGSHKGSSSFVSSS